MTYYLSTDQAAAEAAEAEIFAAYRERIRAIDPEAVMEDGTIAGRNAATGELMPEATRTTGYHGAPRPAVQGFYHPVPAEEDLQLVDPGGTGVDVVAVLNPWPVLDPTGAAPPLPEWVQPAGAHDACPLGYWCTHEGLNYESLLAANVWEPSPESNFWRVSPPLPPQPWKQPTGSADSYTIGDRVTHTAPDRDTELWESLIDGNTTEPGTDGSPGQWFDRYWKPLYDTAPEATEWVQPMPGTAAKPYDVDAVVTHNGKEWKCAEPLCVWEPGVFGWEELPGK